MNELVKPEENDESKGIKGPAQGTTRRADRRAALMNAATTLHKEGKFAAALERWAELRQDFAKPRPAVLLGALRSAQAAGRLDLVDELVAEGASLSPSAASRVQKVGDRVAATPDNEKAWLALQANPPAGIEAELKVAMSPLAVRHARKGRAGQRRMGAILLRLEKLVARYPGNARVRLEHVGMLSALGRHRQAAETARTYRRELPKAVGLALAEAAALEECGDFEAALAAVSGEAGAKPPPRLQAATIRILGRLGRDDEAEAACAAGLAAAPDDVHLLSAYAMLSVRRGDWTEALARWLDAEKRQPDSARVKGGLNTVRLHLSEFEPPAPAGAQSETALFFGRFESLGGASGGCEFGLVQRQYGSASVGMLRWSNVAVEALLRALDMNFAGVGLLENTALRTVRHSATREEYLIYDNVFGFGAHTFIQTKDVPEDKMLAQTAKRLAFLRNKLVEEIHTGKKIFVYNFAANADDSTMLALGDALRRLGPGRLLCAVKADAAHPKGTLRQLNGHVFVGHLGHFMSSAMGENPGIDFAIWLDLCTRTASLCQVPA